MHPHNGLLQSCAEGAAVETGPTEWVLVFQTSDSHLPYLHLPWKATSKGYHPLSWLDLASRNRIEPNRRHPALSQTCYLAERKGFEPLAQVSPCNSLANCPDRPLWHLSIFQWTLFGGRLRTRPPHGMTRVLVFKASRISNDTAEPSMHSEEGVRFELTDPLRGLQFSRLVQ